MRSELVRIHDRNKNILEVEIGGIRIQYDGTSSSEKFEAIRSYKNLLYVGCVNGPHKVWINGRECTTRETSYYFVHTEHQNRISKLPFELQMQAKMDAAEGLYQFPIIVDKKPSAQEESWYLSNGYTIELKPGIGVFNDTYPGVCGAGTSDTWIIKPNRIAK